MSVLIFKMRARTLFVIITLRCVSVYSLAAPQAINGQWSLWGQWSHCSVTCGGGTMGRTRICNNPAPSGGGHDCVGSSNATSNCSMEHCPVNGQWSLWGQWSLCSVTCGGGTMSRTRTCSKPAPSFGGHDCVGLSNSTSNCSMNHCPVNGQWSLWGQWSHCSVTCGGGTMGRTRTCNKPAPSFGGHDCVGSSNATSNCSMDHCPVEGDWSPWEQWSHCSVSCGNGTISRIRTCTNPAPSGGVHNCSGSSSMTSDCSNGHCTVNGNWSLWGLWSHCSVTCGGGTMTRTRACNNPSPSGGGHNCVGSAKATTNCSMTQCPVDGNWSPWGQWNHCSVTCGGGTMGRSRTCNNPAPSFRGHDCVGSSNETSNCSMAHCPVNGKWSLWGQWSHCSVTCGGGTMGRTRTYSNPAPSFGGHVCVGSSNATSNCSMEHCPVDGQWALWGQWSHCSVTCGAGTMGRSRTCNNPAPSFGGHVCVGSSNATSNCSMKDCPVNGQWSLWGQWSHCSVTCGGGTMGRSRTCNNPAPSFGGHDCVGSSNSTSNCSMDHCAVNGQWSLWGQWSHCSVTCGGGTMSRTRTCSKPAPSFGGNDCVGSSNATSNCSMNHCPVNGQWSLWGQWSHCSVTCGGGTMGRTRTCTNPAPSEGGHDCVGVSNATSNCSMENCPVNGQWSQWGHWSHCSVTCGGGSMSRSRTCTNPAPSGGGYNCTGLTKETTPCATQVCPEWSLWFNGTCSVTCGNGTIQRLRHCSSENDADCKGPAFVTEPCNAGHCPVNGQWSPWSHWDHCSVTCGGGTMSRNRACTNPAPSGGGQNCTGLSNETTACSMPVCPEWSIWFNATCSVTCGNGTVQRLRHCSSGNDADCPGAAFETVICDAGPCPVNGQWSSWSNWDHCSVTCDGGTMSRNRTCTNPAPSGGGQNCTGLSKETTACSMQVCPVWSTWFNGACSVTCGNGTVQRLRHCSSGNDADCPGAAFDTVSCDASDCLVNGGWGTWSPWSTCTVTCGDGHHSRSRSCDSPTPKYGGLDCIGENNQTSPCRPMECPHWLAYEEVSSCSATCGQGFIQLKRNCSTGVRTDCTGSAYDEKSCKLTDCVL